MKSLLQKISSKKKLAFAWSKLNKTNKTSHGLNNVSIQDFEENLEDKIRSISKSLRSGNYKFSSNRAVVIPKSNGKFRPLQVPNISDRLVLKAIAIELEQQFKKTIDQSEGVSFAYQKRLGVKDAINMIKIHYERGNMYVLEADLIDFFGQVDKNSLLKNRIFPNLSDSSLNSLIESALNQKVGGLEDIPKEHRKLFDGLNNGIPQGNPLSPLLSNIHLSPFDIHLKKSKFNLVRYADDFVVLGKDKNECLEAYNECKMILEGELKLKMHPLEDGEKTKIINIKKVSFDFLSITFDGKSFYPSKKNVDRLKTKISEKCNGGKVKHNVRSLLTKVSNVLDGWVSAFYYTEVERYAEEIDYHINRQLFLGLNKLKWKFSSTSKGKLPHKYKEAYQSSDCLSNLQRTNSGIPSCLELVLEKRKGTNNN
ncbi:MAG: reverse transcriptase domain-containing protein [Allomuricauda sp.]